LTSPDFAEQLPARAPDYRAVIVAGGDGTVSQTVQALAGIEHPPKLGIIPIGTGNDLARSLGIFSTYKKCGLSALMEVILSAQTVRVDTLGLNGKRFFQCYFGIGIDAKIAHDFNFFRGRKDFHLLFSRSLNELFYGALGIRNIMFRIPYDIRLRYRDTSGETSVVTVAGNMCEIIVTNAHTYAGGARPCSKTHMGDGKFEVTVIRTAGEWIRLIMSRFTGKPLDLSCPDTLQFQTDRIEMHLAGHSYYHTDGETGEYLYRNETPVCITVSGGLDIIAPGGEVF
jgi:diacylglycerol kinase family enzyme